MNDNNFSSNVLAFDALPTTDGGMVVFGVGGSVQSKFQGDGRLYIMQTDNNGEVVKEGKFHNIGSGFPAAVVETNNGYNIFWNKAAGAFLRIVVSKETLDISSTNTITIKAGYTPNYIIEAMVHSDGSFIIQGIGSDDFDDSTYKKAFIAQADAGSNDYISVSANEYTPSDFGTFGNEDMAMLQGLNNCFKMMSAENDIFYSAPYNNEVVIKEIGDPEPIFAHSEIWLSAYCINTNNTFSAVFHNKALNEVKYYSELDLKSDYIDPELSSKKVNPVINVDTDEAMNITIDSSGNKILVVTNNSGQLAIHTFRNNEDESAGEKLIGQTYPYRPVAAFISGDYLILTGNTDIEYQYKRIFFMKIPLAEII